MAVPAHIRANLNKTWSKKRKFVDALREIEVDLSRGQQSPRVDYLYPYRASGGVSVGSRDGDPDQLAEKFRSYFDERLPHRSLRSPFIVRSKIQLQREFQKLKQAFPDWIRWLPKGGPPEEKEGVTVDTELGLFVVSPMTEMHLVFEGAEVVGDQSQFDMERAQLGHLADSLVGLMEGWVRWKRGDEAALDLESKVPTATPFWWLRWYESLVL